MTLQETKTTEPAAPRRRAARRASSRSASAFHAVVEERLRNLEQQLNELKGRVNSLIFLIVGVVVTQVILGLVQ